MDNHLTLVAFYHHHVGLILSTVARVHARARAGPGSSPSASFSAERRSMVSREDAILRVNLDGFVANLHGLIEIAHLVQSSSFVG
jgi:hypothetical protein